VLLLCLAYLYLQVPTGFPEQWAGRDRLPEQSVRVSALYRDALGLPYTPLPVPLYRAAHFALFLALWLPYASLVRRLAGRRAGADYWSFTGALLALALLMPPLLSSDVFYYGITGQMVAEYGANPHVLPPASFPASELLPYNFWRDFPSPYGPAWTSISAGVAALSGGSPLGTSLLFKLLATLCLGATAVLVHRTARELAPGREAQATALWAWNPLVLLESAANGHNDALLSLLLVGGLALLAARRGLAAYALVAASVLVKLTTLPVLALLTLGRLNRGRARDRARRAAVMAAVLATAAILAYAPYWQGPETLRGVAGQPLGSVHGVVAGTAWGLVRALGLPDAALRAGRLASLAAASLLGAWVGWMALRLWRSGARLEARGEGLLWGSVLVLVPVVFVRSYPWYTVPGLALLAAVWPHGRRTTIGLYALGGAWFVFQYSF
jgi:alpha-1,6-mannosyltransferase